MRNFILKLIVLVALLQISASCSSDEELSVEQKTKKLLEGDWILIRSGYNLDSEGNLGWTGVEIYPNCNNSKLAFYTDQTVRHTLAACTIYSDLIYNFKIEGNQIYYYNGVDANTGKTINYNRRYHEILKLENNILVVKEKVQSSTTSYRYLEYYREEYYVW